MPCQEAYGLEAGAASDERRTEVVPERMDRPGRQLVAVLQGLETRQQPLTGWRASVLVNDHTSRWELAAHRFRQERRELGHDRNHPLVPGLRCEYLR